MEKQPNYEQNDLKVQPKKKASPFQQLKDQKEEVSPKEEEMTNTGVVKFVLTLLFGYLIYAIIPTLVLTQLVGLSFGIASAVTFGIAILLVFALGLHKPATPEQLAKRDMNRRKARKK